MAKNVYVDFDVHVDVDIDVAIDVHVDVNVDVDVSVGVDVFSTHTRYVDAPTRPSRGLTKEEYPSRGAPSQPSNRWTPGSARPDAGNPDFAGEGVVKTELIPGRGPMTPCAPAARSAPAAAGTRRRRSSSG